MLNAPRCPTCRRPVSLNTDRCPMCGEDLAGYRSAQVKLLLIGLGICVFLTPSFIVNWAFDRFDNYIAATFFDWPSYLISFACWAALVGGILYFRANRPRSPSTDALSEDPKDEIPLAHRLGADRPEVTEPRESAAGAPGHSAEEHPAGDPGIAQLKIELASLESSIETERMSCMRAMNTIAQLIEAEYAPPTKGTMVAFGWSDAAETVRDFVRKFPQMSAERSRIIASIDRLKNDSA